MWILICAVFGVCLYLQHKQLKVLSLRLDAVASAADAVVGGAHER